MNLPIPNNAALIGAIVIAQWVVRDNAGAYGPGLTSFSPGLLIGVGGS